MKLLSTSETAEKLGISERRVRQLINEGKLAAHKLGRDYAVEESSLASVNTHIKAGRPRRWKGHTIYVNRVDGFSNKFKVEFVSGTQQARGWNEPPRPVPTFPVAIIEVTENHPKLTWNVEPNVTNISIDEFRSVALEEVDDLI